MAAAGDPLLDAWRVNARVTAFLLESVPASLWTAKAEGLPRRCVRGAFAHLHDTRCSWMRDLGGGSGLSVPARLGAAPVGPREAAAALEASGRQLLLMLEAGLANGGVLPGAASAFFYGAMPRDVTLFVGYALSHEAHHRGQVVLAARSLGARLPREVTGGLWQWSSRLKEARALSSRGR